MKTYASGEQPMVGDTIRFTDPTGGDNGGLWTVGDVFTVQGLDSYGDPLTGTEISRAYGFLAKRFTLIARASEAVEFQPGDVVEAISLPRQSGWSPQTRRWGLGDHLTVTDVQHPGGHPKFQGIDYSYSRLNFKLVHRPDPAPAVTPAGTLRSAPAGTRVRVTSTVEGVIQSRDPSDNYVAVLMDDRGGRLLRPEDVTAVEVLEEPWKPEAGKLARFGRSTVPVLAIDGDDAFIRWQTGIAGTVKTSGLSAP